MRKPRRKSRGKAVKLKVMTWTCFPNKLWPSVFPIGFPDRFPKIAS